MAQYGPFGGQTDYLATVWKDHLVFLFMGVTGLAPKTTNRFKRFKPPYGSFSENAEELIFYLRKI